MGLRPSHGTWQQVDDPAHPPAFTPAEAAQRLPVEAWQRTVRFDSHGTQLVRYVAELALGPSYGPDKGVRLIAATLDPTQLKPESTWYLATSFPLAQVSAEQVYELYRLRDWIEHFYKPVKHELGWADYQMRPEQAIVRHWQLVLLAYTFSLLVGAVPTAPPTPAAAAAAAASSSDHASTGGGKIGARRVTTGGVGGHAAPGAELALPLGTAAALLDALVAQRPTARAGRAPRPRRPLPPAGGAGCPDLTNHRLSRMAYVLAHISHLPVHTFLNFSEPAKPRLLLPRRPLQLVGVWTARDCYMQHRFSAEPPRIATRGLQVPRTGRAKRVGHWVLQTVMLPGVARNVDNCQKCRIGVRNVGCMLAITFYLSLATVKNQVTQSEWF
jgi:hypothetical protein